MVNLAQKQEERQRINDLLKQEPQYPAIEKAFTQLVDMESAILHEKELIEAAQNRIKDITGAANDIKIEIKGFLEAVEGNTGYASMPLPNVTVYLRNTPESYDVKDIAAVPADYIIQKPQVDKRKLNKDIEAGIIDKQSNWLEVKPAYRSLCVG